MKTLVWIIFLITMSNMSYSQELAGKWNGALAVQGNQLRIVFNVQKSGDHYEVTMDSPDQNTKGIIVTTTQFSYPNVTFKIANLDAVFEGVMSDKGITGKWLQSGTALFLLLAKSEEPADQKK